MNELVRAEKKEHTILVLDDEDTIRHVVAETLKKAGYDVVHFRDKEDGLDWIRSHSVSLVISDIKSPRMDGLTFLRRLKANQSTNRIPVVFVTGVADFTIACEALKLGASDYLTKPSELTQLMHVVRRVLHQAGE